MSPLIYDALERSKHPEPMNSAPERPRMEFVGVMKGGIPRKDFNCAVRAFMNACRREKRFARK